MKRILLTGVLVALAILAVKYFSRTAPSSPVDQAHGLPHSESKALTGDDLVHLHEPTTDGESGRSGRAQGPVLRVVNANREPVSGAAVHASIDHGFVGMPAGVTDLSGVFHLVGLKDKCNELLVKANGFVPEIARLPIPTADMEVVLVRGSKIAGRVIAPSGEPLGAGIAVFMWPSDSHSDGRVEAHEAVGGSLLQQLTLTDESGGFVLDGLRPHSTFIAVAAGKGVLTRDPVELRTDADLVSQDLVCSWIYATRILVKDSAGNSIPAFGPGETRSRWLSQCEDPAGRACIPPAACLELLGLSSIVDGPSMRLCMYSTSIPKEEIGPNTVSMGLNGYSQNEIQFNSPKLVFGISDEELVLKQTARGFGALEISFAAADGSPVGRFVPSGILRLSPDDGEKAFDLVVASGNERTRRYENVPEGNYTVQYQAEASRLVIGIDGGGSLAIVGGTVATAVISVPSLGSIEVSVTQADGSYFSGPMSFYLGQGMPKVLTANKVIHGNTFEAGSIVYGNTTTHSYSKSPYRIEGLSDGDYSLEAAGSSAIGQSALAWPSSLPPAKTLPAVLTINGGSQAHCDFRLRSGE